MHDPVFGLLEFERGIWAYIPKANCPEFMVSVDAPETGPTDRQRDFFQEIRANLPDLHLRARDIMRSRANCSVDVNGLSIYSVEIGDDGETARQHFVLELSDCDASLIHRVVFRAGDPVDYGCDE